MQTVVLHRSYTPMNAKVPIPTTEIISSFMNKYIKNAKEKTLRDSSRLCSV